ncbi:MAG TPA: hypothetical protein VHZ31_04565 [Solirubrobacteraceae bacterium]|jgi:hypothetical protein|nr:hypothetical protein [Solirubrobacteraceae bacterium]
MTLRKLLLATVLLSCLCTTAAQAAPDQVSFIQDDDQLLYRGDRTAARTLVTARSLGADAVRVTVLWSVVADGADLNNADIKRLKTKALRKKALAQRKRFKATDPHTYPTRNWDRYDNVVKQATALGMRVLFTVTGPGPRYAHRVAPPSQRANAGTYKPIPSRFRQFVQAVGTRYSGKYRDENGIRKALPRVALWSLWNEPNQPGWLTPQWEKVDGQVVPASPALYRELYQYGRQGLALSGHGGDVVLLGETAPLGSTKRGPRNGIEPVPFLRELVCVNPAGQQYTGMDATRRHCDDFQKLGAIHAFGYAHHPYTKKAAPTVKPSTPDDITIANIGTLGPILDQLSVESGGKIPSAMPILLTEFGYESNPPDPRNGIPLLKQAQYNELADFLAYNDPRVKATTQFQLRDAAPVAKYPKGSRLYWFTYQSGLYNLKGEAKPAAFAYAFPLVMYPAGAGMTGFWGQMRFRPNGSQDVALMFWRPTPSTKPSLCGDPAAGWKQQTTGTPTNFRGFFTGAIPTPGPGGEYCAAYLDPTKGKIVTGSLPAKA